MVFEKINSATIVPENNFYPVLLKEVLSIISSKWWHFIDCTFGGGILKKNITVSKNKVIADRDQKKINS